MLAGTQILLIATTELLLIAIPVVRLNRIIDPLASRCAKFRFRPLEGDTMGDKLVAICAEEGVKVSDEVRSWSGYLS